MRSIDTVVLHYSATYEDQDIGLAEIRAMHKARGWSREGYHEIIRLDGTIEHGRPWDMVGAGVKNQNTGKLHICCIGGLRRGDSRGYDTRTSAQVASTIFLIEDMERKLGKKLRVVGHSELAPTECPGFIGSKWWADNKSELPPKSTPVSRPYLAYGKSGNEVIALKNALQRIGYHPLAINSSYFGRYTEEQVKAFQRDAEIEVDGKVGPVTWTTLAQKGAI